MQILVAVDLLNGTVVRLTKGDVSTAKLYSADVVGTARNWQWLGASGLHVVDLNAALGTGSNIESIEAVIEMVSIPVQVGGGIRSLEYARKLMDLGAQRIVVGTLAFKKEDALKKLVNEFGPERIVVALDFERGNVLVEGWAQRTDLTVDDAIGKFLALGINRFLVTAVEKDGMLSGPDSSTYLRLCSNSKIEIIASGGISTIKDLRALKRAGVKSAIIGKALYEGLLTMEQIASSVAGK